MSWRHDDTDAGHFHDRAAVQTMLPWYGKVLPEGTWCCSPDNEARGCLVSAVMPVFHPLYTKGVHVDSQDFPVLLKELVEQGHEPYTVTKHMRITDEIADARYELVTPAAAEIYGVESPEKLIGRYLSQTLMRADYQRGVLFAIARHHRLPVPVPVDYVTRIIRPDHEVVGVRKQTVQLTGSDGATYWITKLQLVHELDVPQDVTAEMLQLTPRMVFDWAGMASVADVEHLLHARWGTPQTATPDDIHRMIDTYHQTNKMFHPESGELTRQTLIHISGGESRLLPDGRWIHRCGKCAGIWVSDTANPARCIRHRQDKRGARCATSQWRDIAPEYWERAAGMGQGATAAETMES